MKRQNKNGVLIGRMNRIKWAIDNGKKVSEEDRIFLNMCQSALAPKPKQSKTKLSTKFYSSKAWTTLRYRVLTHYGPVCMCCGKSGVAMQVDHIKPRSRFPELALSFDNMQVLCAPCNFGKSAWDKTDHRPKLIAV